jgi:hypothetical protein
MRETYRVAIVNGRPTGAAAFVTILLKSGRNESYDVNSFVITSDPNDATTCVSAAIDASAAVRFSLGVAKIA